MAAQKLVPPADDALATTAKLQHSLVRLRRVHAKDAAQHAFICSKSRDIIAQSRELLEKIRRECAAS
jgi:hypothetical protein